MSKRLTKEDEHLFSSALHSAYAKDSTPMTTTPEQRAEWKALENDTQIPKFVRTALISHIETLEAENARLKEALAWFHHNGKALASDIYSAHRLRGNGASQWMTEDDRDFRRDLDAALDRARAAMGESE